MKKWAAVWLSASLTPCLAYGYDNGPQVVGCDYRLGAQAGSDSCLVVGSGMAQGISWVVFEVAGRRYRYSDAASEVLEQVDRAGEVLATYPVRNTSAPCRPGGGEADSYELANGDQICLYW